MISGSSGIIDRERVKRVWVGLKRRYPVLGARVEEKGEDVSFVVSENRVLGCEPDEVTFKDEEEGASWDEAVAFVDKMANTNTDVHVLDEGLLARLWVLKQRHRVGDGEGERFYVILVVAHVITDGMSNMTLLRRFLEGICGEGDPEGGWDWEERLKMCLASADLNPVRGRMSVARRRWRWAIADVLTGKRLERLEVRHLSPFF